MSPSRTLTLLRGRSTDQGTPGVLLRPDGSRLCWTMELPWKGNAQGVSSIPPGEYLCRMRRSPHFGPVYEILNVPHRTNVLLHSANYGGDKSKGWKCDLRGCVGLGLYHGKLKGQLAVFVARPAVTRLLAEMKEQPFTLEIVAYSEPAKEAA